MCAYSSLSKKDLDHADKEAKYALTAENSGMVASNTTLDLIRLLKPISHPTSWLSQLAGPAWVIRDQRGQPGQLTIHHVTSSSRHALALTICHVAKFKIRRYVLRSDSPTSMLANVSYYLTLNIA